MNSIDTLATFFGWMTLVNIGIYIFVAIGVTALRGLVVQMNSRLFGLSESDIRLESFRYVALYKLVITVFCFVPYVTLKVMG